MALSVLLLSTTTTPTSFPSSAPASKVKANFVKQLQQLGQGFITFRRALQQGDESTTRAAYQRVRHQFKRVEFLIAYLAPELYMRQLNESPLLKPSAYTANKEIHQPGGWQVLDELLAQPAIAWEEVQTLTEDLHFQLVELESRMQRAYLHDALVIHAIKEQLLRSFTMGITGFDTPGASDAIDDLEQVNTSLSEVLTIYEGYFPNLSLQAIQASFAAVDYTSFEEFDRYGYLVGQLVPILEQLEGIRTELELETKEELSQFYSALNSRFVNPFQKDLLRPSYYADLPINEVTPERIVLGKALFNDPLLSDNRQTSCATCHQAEHAFTDQLTRSQNGDQSATTSRNSPSLNYAIYASAYFYDLRAHDLNNQFDHVIHDAKEFNSSYAAIITKLKRIATYATQFADAYPHHASPINAASINHALKCYLISLPQFNAPFDRWAQVKAPNIPEEVRAGFNLFMGKAQCATCHFPPTFSGLVPPAYTDSESEVLGILTNEDYAHPVLDDDQGRRSNGIVKDNFEFFERSFKTVSLRNVARTAPYMHNGSIQSLEQVVEFYDLGGGGGMGLDVPHQTLPMDALELTVGEKQALVAFMESLSDAPKK